MEIIDKPSDLPHKIKSFTPFHDISEKQIQWLTDRGELRKYEEGEYIFIKDDPADHLFIVIDGDLVIRFQQKGEWLELGQLATGEITGVLPYSRMSKTNGFGIALRDSFVFTLHKDFFKPMTCECYDLTGVLVSNMVNRVRHFTTMRTQNEKLMALGRMAAGLAHELNNPASAMVRSAAELHSQVHASPEKFKKVVTMRVTEEQTDKVNEILFSKLKNMGASENLSMMEKEEATDDVLDWLEENDIDFADDLAEIFVDFALGPDDLEKFKETIKGKTLSPILRWVASTLNLERLVNEIQESADRIEKLVRSVKDYSHMDKAKDKDFINIHDGIRSTVIMLKHKFKQKGINIVKELDDNIPKMKAFAGELNQVWTNLIDNALDAMEKNGQLSIKTYKDREFVKIDIADNGSGIPEEVKNNIFEPFFTTKPLGKGTGMGLDIVKRIVDRHRGKVEVESEEGKGTKFTVCIPIEK